MTQEPKRESAAVNESVGQEKNGERSGWHAPLPEKLPEPTAWPAVVALGACLAAWGVVTSWMISTVGVVLFAVGVGGWIVRMRHERAE